MEGEPVLKKASITQFKLGFTVWILSHCMKIVTASKVKLQ